MQAPLGRRTLATMVVAGASILGSSPAFAGADTSTDYHPNAGAREFASSAAGWTGSSSSGGLCVPVLLCPAVTNSYQGSGGASGGGDGYLRTRLASLLGAASDSSGIWTSPAFTYRGAGGEKPDSLTLTLKHRAKVDTLLGVAGNSADYSVQVLEGASGDARAAVPVNRESLVDGSKWVGSSPVRVNPDNLTLGGTYRIRIISRFVSGVSVIPGATADYDNVLLRAVHVTPPSNGQNGQNGHDAGSGLSIQEVRAIIEKGLPGSAVVSGNRIFIRLRCPSRVKGRCRYGVVGLARRGGARVTLPRFARIDGSKTKRLGLSIRPGARSTIMGKKRQLFRIRVRALGRTTTYFKQLRLVHPR